MNKEELFTFIATWEEDLGTEVVEIYPEDDNFDINTIASNLFLTYFNFYKKEKSSKFFFRQALININKIARVFLLRGIV